MGASYRIVDLPGTYSLTANSPEEVIAREFILREKPDVVVAVVSAANLERSLYLVSELICLPAPLVVALNMMDVADQEGIHVEPEVLQAALGVPVVPLTATRAAGVHELLAEVERCLMGERKLVPHLPEIRTDHRAIMDEVIGQITGFVPAPYPTRLGGDEAARRRRGNDHAACKTRCRRNAGRPSRPFWSSTMTPCWRLPPGATTGSGA